MAENIFSSERVAAPHDGVVSSRWLGASHTPHLDALLRRDRAALWSGRDSFRADALERSVHAGAAIEKGGLLYKAPNRQLKEMNIFVYMVDDDALLGRSIAWTLEARGINVKVETDPFQALAYLQTNVEIDVILMDLIMPGLSGSKIYEELEKSAPDRCARLVFLTGYAEMGPKWLKASGRLTIEKPVSVEHILRVIEEYAKLEAPRGPGGSDAQKVMPTKPSHPELPALYDEESEVTTGILELASQVKGISKEALKELEHRYMLQKVQAHEKVMGEFRTLLKFAKYSWAIAIALAGLFTGVQELLKHVIFK